MRVERKRPSGTGAGKARSSLDSGRSGCVTTWWWVSGNSPRAPCNAGAPRNTKGNPDGPKLSCGLSGVHLGTSENLWNATEFSTGAPSRGKPQAYHGKTRRTQQKLIGASSQISKDFPAKPARTNPRTSPGLSMMSPKYSPRNCRDGLKVCPKSLGNEVPSESQECYVHLPAACASHTRIAFWAPKGPNPCRHRHVAKAMPRE